MEELMIAMWPVWVALLATLVVALIERNDELKVAVPRILEADDFDVWDVEVCIDQAVRLANGEDL